VDLLRGVEELVLTVNDPPLGIDAGADHQRDERVVDLRDAAAEGRRREMQDALSLQRRDEPRDLGGQAAPEERGVVGERLVSDVDRREHGSEPSGQADGRE
jgi:hypothetical protein